MTASCICVHGVLHAHAIYHMVGVQQTQLMHSQEEIGVCLSR